jgi:hypothetical protein
VIRVISIAGGGDTIVVDLHTKHVLVATEQSREQDIRCIALKLVEIIISVK